MVKFAISFLVAALFATLASPVLAAPIIDLDEYKSTPTGLNHNRIHRGQGHVHRQGRLGSGLKRASRPFKFDEDDINDELRLESRASDPSADLVEQFERDIEDLEERAPPRRFSSSSHNAVRRPLPPPPTPGADCPPGTVWNEKTKQCAQTPRPLPKPPIRGPDCPAGTLLIAKTGKCGPRPLGKATRR